MISQVVLAQYQSVTDGQTDRTAIRIALCAHALS